jgi:hypothetical protein
VIYYFCTHLRMNFPGDVLHRHHRRRSTARSRQSNATESQFVGASGHVPEMVRTITAYFGSRIGTRYAEPFASTEMLGILRVRSARRRYGRECRVGIA